MVPVIRSRTVSPFVLALALGLILPTVVCGYPFPDHHKQSGVYLAPVPVMYPYYGAAPIVPFASAPVLVGAISTATATSYAAPVTASAPTYYVSTVNTTTTASAPSTVTTASAPAPTVYYLTPGTGTAGAPGTASAPGSSNLSQADIDAINEELVEYMETLKDEKVTGTERRTRMLDKAKELIAEAKSVSVDELKAADKSQARRLVKQALDGAQSGIDSAPGKAQQGTNQPQGTNQVQYVVYPQALAPIYGQYSVYPMVPMVPVVPVKPCGHRFFCLCKTAYP